MYNKSGKYVKQNLFCELFFIEMGEVRLAPMTKLLAFGTGVFACLWYSYCTVQKHKEKELLRSPLYAEAVKDWEQIQAWFVRDYKKDFEPFSILLDTGGLVALEITVRADKEGKLFLPDDLSPSQFILAVSKVKKHFAKMM